MSESLKMRQLEITAKSANPGKLRVYFTFGLIDIDGDDDDDVDDDGTIVRLLLSTSHV